MTASTAALHTLSASPALPLPLHTMRVALVHDWLTGMRGGEYVLEAIAELFPQAEIFTLIKDHSCIEGPLADRRCHTSWLQSVPRSVKHYRQFLPLMPHMIESFDLSGFDLIISSSHCVAKGIQKPQDSVHISYVHAPMRYMWDRFDDYFGPQTASLPVRMAARMVRGYLQDWDRRSSAAARVDAVMANSQFIAQQIQAAYGRTSQVVYPFVDLNRFSSPRRPSNFYLMVGAFAPNKRVDLAIETFNELGLPLKIVGKGQEERRLRRLAGAHVEFLGALSNQHIEQLYSEARAFIFPGVEDFGITPLEAMASGLPVIAYAAAGALETVIHGRTGLLFDSQTIQSLGDAVLKVESGEVTFKEEALRQRAAEFSKARFQMEFMRCVQAACSERWTIEKSQAAFA